MCFFEVCARDENAGDAMRIFLTGAGGFFGREMAAHLRARGHVVKGLMRQAAQCVADEDVVGDVLKIETIRQAVHDFKPDALVHAAWSGVPVATRDHLSQYDNVPGSVALFQLAAEAGAQIIIGLGTQAEYGLTTKSVLEDAPTRPVTHYGMAKLATGHALLRFTQHHGLRGLWLRVFGLYGPRETVPSMLPWVARQFALGQVPALTPCTQMWDYLHVRDGARAIADLLAMQDAAGLFNLASGQAPLLRDTVLQLRDLMAPEIEPNFGAVPFGPDQVHCLAADVSRLKAAIGFVPQISLAEGLGELALEAYGALAS